MNTKAFLKLLQVLLPVALIITSCGPDSAAADTTGADVTSGTAAVDYVQSDDVQPGDTQKGLSPKEDTVETSSLVYRSEAEVRKTPDFRCFFDLTVTIFTITRALFYYPG